jgi:transcription elongation factor GreA
MTGKQDNLSLGEGANRFLATLPLEQRDASQQEVYAFVRWQGWDKPFSVLTAPEIGNYAERLSLSDTDHERKLGLVRAFLTYAKGQGWTDKNMSVHLKSKKGKSKGTPAGAGQEVLTHTLSREGYAKLQSELAELKVKRTQVIEEMRRAAADKDFRENAPLEAAREQRGRVEGQIRELESILKSAQIIGADNHTPSLKASIGDTVALYDTDLNEVLHYTIVSPRETDPAGGKISSSSPLGKAILGKAQDEFIEVVAPAGRLRYQIKKVERQR